MRVPLAALLSATSDHVPASVVASIAYRITSRAWTINVSVAVATLPSQPASPACTVNVEAPTASGVPLTTPDGDNVNPAGSDPAVSVHVVRPVPPFATSDA